MSAQAEWALKHEAVLPYGPEGRCTVVHVRAYEHSGEQPVVILGQFGKYRGDSLTNTVEDAATAAQATFYPRGERLRFVQYTPFQTLYGDGGPEFREVTFMRRRHLGALRRWLRRRHHAREGRVSLAATVVTIDGVRRHVVPQPALEDLPWEFFGPNWRELDLSWPREEAEALQGSGFVRPATVCIPELLGRTEVTVWPREFYMPALIGGPEAARLDRERYEAVRRRIDSIFGFAEALAQPEPGSFVELDTVEANENRDSPQPPPRDD